MFLYFFTFFTLSFLIAVSDGKYIEGTLSTTTTNWKFLTRFCFMSRRGSLQYEFEYPESYLTQNLLLYWDAPGLWSSVYKSSLSCEQRVEKLSRVYNQIYDLNREQNLCYPSKNGTIHCRSPRFVFSSSRDRWWHIVLSRCTSKVGLQLKYKMWLRNGEPGDLFYEHFSADEFYILQMDIAFLLFYIAILAVAIVFAVMLCKKKHFHTTYRMFILSTSLQLAHILFACILWGAYANDGVMRNGLRYFADALNAASQIIFILMLLLMALGYTIVCGKLPTWMMIGLMIFTCVLSIVYVVLFIYEAISFDPGWVLYRYESPSGYGLMALVILSWLIFFIACIFTLATHKRKRAFYIRFLVFYTIWFWAVPCIVFISINHIPPWMREKIVNGLDLSVMALGHVFYLFLTRPTEENGNFPYHIRTEQIDVITLGEATEKALDEASEGNNFHDIQPPPTTDFNIFTTSGCGNGTSQPPPMHMNEFNGNTRQPAPPFPPQSNGFAATNFGGPLPPIRSTSVERGGGEGGEGGGGEREGGGGGGGRGEGGEVTYVPRNLDALFSFGPQNSQRPRDLDL